MKESFKIREWENEKVREWKNERVGEQEVGECIILWTTPASVIQFFKTEESIIAPP